MADTQFAGIVIRVEDMELCRAFYRDIIGLGAPVMDSSFWCEFAINDSVSLCLEQITPGESLPDPSTRSAWILKVDDLEVFTERLSCYGYISENTSADRFGYIVRIFADPEGNLFYATEKKQRQV